MSKIRMNEEYRAKILNRFVEHIEGEETQEKTAYLSAIANMENIYQSTFEVAKKVVERAYPKEDVETCKTLKEKYGSPLDVVAKDKCFYFSRAKEISEEEDQYESEHSEHFDFGLFGATNTSEYSYDEGGKKFAYAYMRDILKGEGLNPDIIAQQKDNQDNPHKSQCINANDEALGRNGRYSHYNSDRDNSNGITKQFDETFYLDIIGTSHCRSRTIDCTTEEFETFKIFKSAKSNVVNTHQIWIDTILKQKEMIKTGLKAYRTLIEGVELMQELGIEIDEADLVKVNSTGLTMYNPVNLADMIKGMKNKTMTREQKIAERMKYDSDHVVVVDNSSSAVN